ncbi:hypothetical protein FDX04_08710 [Citrobacter sp. wls615]|uniref:phage tail fiber protein n=1 Tax=Citrobacter sp. wls615 TaxID=2576435 RepID=UPI0010C9440C|nr:hypothetical protein [Citrobacter sp. wls615]TKV15362.1 hypothetical protein FDX04_08710 [Citrobacter sp. wls615]
MANIYTGNGLQIFYNEDIANRLPQNAGNEKINEIAAMPTLRIASAISPIETYNSEFSEKLPSEQDVAPIEITVNYIPDDYTHTFLDSATESQEEFQLIMVRRHSEGTLDYSLMNGRIASASLSGDKDSVVQKTYSFVTSEMIVRDATALASVELYEGSYGVGSNGVDVPQYEPITPTGNSFIKVPATQDSNPLGVDMMGVGLIDGNTFSSIAMTKTGNLAIYAKNATNAWQRILTSNLGDSKYVALTGDQSIDGVKTFIKGIYVDSLTANNGISGKSLAVTEGITADNITVTTSTLGVASADSLTLGQPLSVANGGTGAKTPADARTALGVNAAGTFDVVPVLNGGTGATTAIQARINLGIGSTAGFEVLPVENGGTGAVTALGARTNLDVYSKAESDGKYLDKSKNLSDLTNASAARTNINVYSKVETDGKYLDKSKNLSDVVNIGTAKINLQVDRLQQINNSTLLTSQDTNQRLILRDDKVWGYFDATGNRWNALGVTQGGTGASTPADARTNLQIDRFIQFDNTATHIYADAAKNLRLTIAAFSDTTGSWGVYNNKSAIWMPLGIAQGGTGATSVNGARINLQLDRLAQASDATSIRSADPAFYFYVNDTREWGAYDSTTRRFVALPVNRGGTGALDAAGARTNLQVDRLVQSGGSTILYTPSRDVALTLQDSLWGVYKAGTNDTIPLGIYSGGTGATTAAGARTNLGLDTYSSGGTQTIVQSPNKEMYLYINDNGSWGGYSSRSGVGALTLGVGNGGTGGKNPADAAKNLNTLYMGTEVGGSGFNYNDLNGNAGAAGVIRAVNNAGLATNAPTSYRRNAQLYGYGGLTTTSYNAIDGITSQMYISHRGQLAYRMKWGGGYVDSWSTSLDNSNTTIDANGFIKAASPIVKVFADGTSELNSESEGVVTKRVEMGVYEVFGTKGLNQDGWTIEIPQDVNGNRLCFVETSYDEENEVLTLKTFTRKFDINTAMVIAGEPMEIPSGRWIDLRVEMPEDSIYNLRFPEPQDEQNK